MPFTAKHIRAQLTLLKPLLESCSLKTTRKAQDLLGEMMEAKLRDQVVVKEHPFPDFRSAWVVPREERRQGVILYLHGGGYTCGGLDYALGFGSHLAIAASPHLVVKILQKQHRGNRKEGHRNKIHQCHSNGKIIHQIPPPAEKRAILRWPLS